jgi:hypothetical protein
MSDATPARAIADALADQADVTARAPALAEQNAALNASINNQRERADAQSESSANGSFRVCLSPPADPQAYCRCV